MIASCTHLSLKSVFSLLRFFILNSGAMKDLKDTKGLIYKSFNATSMLDFWTLTVWETEADMKAYIKKKHHMKAMVDFRKVADTIKSKVVSWEVTEIPSWQEAIQRNDESDYEYEKSPYAKLAQ